MARKIKSKKGRVVIDTSRRTAKQVHRENMMRMKNEKYKANVTEAQKTARSKARAASISTAVSSSVGQAEATKREVARRNSEAIIAQYSSLINGARDQENAALPEDKTGSPDRKPIPLN